MKKVENLDRTKLTRVEKFHLDLFLFSFYTGGMPMVNMANLNWDTIVDDIICYERIKFSKKATMPFIEKVKVISEKYKEKCIDNYILPIYQKRHITDEQKYKKVKNITYKANLTLRKIAEIIGYEEEIHMYSARSTFISTMIDAGYHPVEVAKMSGNSEKTIYKHYYKIRDL